MRIHQPWGAMPSLATLPGPITSCLGFRLVVILLPGVTTSILVPVGTAGESNTIRLGKTNTQTATYIVGIRGATVAGGVSVMVDASGHLGTITSSARFKDSIQPMGKASEAILSLQPVTFRYKKDLL